MDTLSKKTVATKRGFTYTYWTSPAATGKPTVLLLHGFPDVAAEWEGVITNFLVPKGYGVVAPDLLGAGGTSKPTDPIAYKWGGMISDVCDVLDAEGIQQVVVLGHDWGSAAAQVFYNLRPERTVGLVVVNVPYMGVPHGPFDLDGNLEKAQKVFGYGNYWYWKLFVAEDGGKLMTENADKVFDCAHSSNLLFKVHCTEGTYRRILEGKEAIEPQLPAYATKEMKQEFVTRIRRDGFEAPLCWYKSHVQQHQANEANPDNVVVNVPTFFIGYEGDCICRKELMNPAIAAGHLPHLTSIMLEGYHWGFLEYPDLFGKTLTQWLDSTYKA